MATLNRNTYKSFIQFISTMIEDSEVLRQMIILIPAHQIPHPHVLRQGQVTRTMLIPQHFVVT
jgi:hypothetical protein